MGVNGRLISHEPHTFLIHILLLYHPWVENVHAMFSANLLTQYLHIGGRVFQECWLQLLDHLQSREHTALAKSGFKCCCSAGLCNVKLDLSPWEKESEGKIMNYLHNVLEDLTSPVSWYPLQWMYCEYLLKHLTLRVAFWRASDAFSPSIRYW